MVADGTGYDVEATMPLEWTAKGISSSGPVEMRAEGFGVPADRKQQAVTAIVGYLNLYVRAAPGLIVERAEIVDGGLTVTGSAPQRLEYPSSAP
jgi:hypothetical protein